MNHLVVHLVVLTRTQIQRSFGEIRSLTLFDQRSSQVPTSAGGRPNRTPGREAAASAAAETYYFITPISPKSAIIIVAYMTGDFSEDGNVFAAR